MGTQVIAQGVAPMPDEAAWRVVFHSIDPAWRCRAFISPGFILVDTGGVNAVQGGRALHFAGAGRGGVSCLADVPADPHRRAADRASPHRSRTVDMVNHAEDGTAVYTSDLNPLALHQGHRSGARSSGARRVDNGHRKRDAGTRLRYARWVRAEATDGSAASLRVGEAATLSGDVALIARGRCRPS